MRPQIIDMGLLVNDPNGISVSQKPAAGGVQNLTITGAQASGGVATNTNGIAQLVGINSDGNDAGVTFSVTGLDANGQSTTESGITGPSSSTVYTTFYFQTVTAVTISADATGNLIVGWDVTASSGASTRSIPVNWRNSPFNATGEFDLTAGTMTGSWQHTSDSPTATYTNGFHQDAKWTEWVGLSAITADDISNIAFPIRAVRFIQTTPSATGTCTVYYTQSN